MGFVNEKLTDEIIKKYDLNNVFPKGWRPPRWNSWMIDKERNIWLYRAYSDEAISRYSGCEPSYYMFWGFSWEGEVDTTGTANDMKKDEIIFVRNVEALTYKSVFPLILITGYTFPPNVIGREEEFFEDLKAAFKAQDIDLYLLMVRSVH